MRYREVFRPGSLAAEHRQFAPCKEMWIPEFGKFCLWNPESWAFESGIQIKESGIPLTMGIGNPRYTDKKSRIPYLESGIHGLESRIHDCLRPPCVLHGVKQRRNDEERVYESGWAGIGGTGDKGVVWGG